MQYANGSKPDVFNKVSTEMALAHNAFLRILNAVYAQAIYVAPQDQADFLSYASCLFIAIKCHHEGEETTFFPAVERLSGEVGIMEQNVKEHTQFNDALKRTEEYINECLQDQTQYSGEHLRSLIKVLGPVLRSHLVSEIDTLEDLRKYGEGKMSTLHDEFQAMVNTETVRHSVPAIFNALDRTYEDGLWKDFPPMPWALKWTVQNVFMRWNSAWWKFAPCDPEGYPKPYPYARPA
ncbi:hypothetical protein CC79DRAFT_1389702 [Sarocladium strictum]